MKNNTSFSIPVSIYFQYSHQLLVHITCVCLTHVLVSLLEISKLFLKEAKHCECVRFHLTSSGLSNLFELSLKPRINTSTWECHRELLIASVWKSSFLLFCLRQNFYREKFFQVPNFGLTRGSTHKTNTSFSIPVSIYFQYSHQLLVHITCVCLTHIFVSLFGNI